MVACVQSCPGQQNTHVGDPRAGTDFKGVSLKASFLPGPLRVAPPDSMVQKWGQEPGGCQGEEGCREIL